MLHSYLHHSSCCVICQSFHHFQPTIVPSSSSSSHHLLISYLSSHNPTNISLHPSPTDVSILKRLIQCLSLITLCQPTLNSVVILFLITCLFLTFPHLSLKSSTTPRIHQPTNVSILKRLIDCFSLLTHLTINSAVTILLT